MSHKRKNKSQWSGPKDEAQDWFKANKKRQRTRKAAAKKSKRKNRG